MAARRPFWKWRHWKSIVFCLWPPSTCIWNLKLKFQRKLDLCSGNHAVNRQTDGRTDGQGESSIPLSNFVGRGYKYARSTPMLLQEVLHISRVSDQKGPTRHAYAWLIGPFWQDTLDFHPLATEVTTWPHRLIIAHFTVWEVAPTGMLLTMPAQEKWRKVQFG